MATESIYNWVKVAPPPVVKPPLYRSLHDATQPLSNSTLREATRTKAVGVIGRDLRGTVRPDDYLRAHELTSSSVDASTPRECYCSAGAPRSARRQQHSSSPPRPPRPRPAAAKFTRQSEGLRKPPIPPATVSSGSSRARESPRNFVETNAIEAITAVPRKLPAPQQDWLAKPDYGKVPDYLKQIKQDVSAEATLQKTESMRRMEASARTGPNGTRLREMPEQERDELLAALRARHKEVRARRSDSRPESSVAATSSPPPPPLGCCRP